MFQSIWFFCCLQDTEGFKQLHKRTHRCQSLILGNDLKQIAVNCASCLSCCIIPKKHNHRAQKLTSTHTRGIDICGLS